MKILIVGSGGREHALSWAIAASPLCTKLWCAPGNAGLAGQAECVPIAAGEVDGLAAFARAHAGDCVVVGPDQHLDLGPVKPVAQADTKASRPSEATAALNGSTAVRHGPRAPTGDPT